MEEKTGKEVYQFIRGLFPQFPPTKSLLVGYLATLQRVEEFLNGKPQNVGQAEAEYMALLRDSGFSFDDISLIMDRSKSTIHDVFEKTITQAPKIPAS